MLKNIFKNEGDFKNNVFILRSIDAVFAITGINFSGKQVNNANLLNWQVDNETNLNNWELQKRLDG